MTKPQRRQEIRDRVVCLRLSLLLPAQNLSRTYKRFDDCKLTFGQYGQTTFFRKLSGGSEGQAYERAAILRKN